MRPLALRSVPALLAVGLAAVLSGCGPGNLVEGLRHPLRNPWWLIIVVLDVIAIVEVLNSSRSTGDKALWTIVIVIFPFVGLLAYYFFGRK